MSVLCWFLFVLSICEIFPRKYFLYSPLKIRSYPGINVLLCRIDSILISDLQSVAQERIIAVL